MVEIGCSSMTSPNAGCRRVCGNPRGIECEALGAESVRVSAPAIHVEMVDHDSLHRRGASALSAASVYEVVLAVSVAYAGFSVASPANVGFRPKLAATTPAFEIDPFPPLSRAQRRRMIKEKPGRKGDDGRASTPKVVGAYFFCFSF